MLGLDIRGRRKLCGLTVSSNWSLGQRLSMWVRELDLGRRYEQAIVPGINAEVPD